MNISPWEFMAVLGFLHLHHHIQAHAFPLGSVETDPCGLHQGAVGLAFGRDQQETRGWGERVGGVSILPTSSKLHSSPEGFSSSGAALSARALFRVLVAAPLLPQV